jgi:hypothetical protein
MERLQRIILWFFVVAVGLTALLVALGWWGITHAGYEVPDGDLPGHLIGRWDWSSDSVSCGPKTHEIAFSPDRRTMTIAKPAYGADTGWTVTYDIMVLSPSRLRGAIRGEKRRSDEGALAVWDLVLFAPDEYRWQRVDWKKWQYTGAVRRCGPSAKPGGP